MKQDRKVFCLGVFDMFHFGHLNLLQRASEFGALTVGVVVDEAVKKQKGSLRPLICEQQRLKIVDSLKFVFQTVFVDHFIIPSYYITNYDGIIIGEDQNHIINLKDIPAYKFIKLNRTEGVSTSQIVKRIKQEVIDNYNKTGKLEV